MTDGAHGSDVDGQITALTEIVGALATTVSQLSDRAEHLARAHRSSDQSEQQDDRSPAAWVWFTPPAAAEDDPRITVENFVAWYNLTYVGVEGTRAKPIPDCWRQHPGLAMEVANLAYSWRAANLGEANPREAQYWHHQSRPGFTDRLTREWVHADCIDGDHRAAGAAERPDRFTLAEHSEEPIGPHQDGQPVDGEHDRMGG
ncbi:MAG: hypothetical protein ACRDRR_15205 [Pseudonocardiaceae bacterium]